MQFWDGFPWDPLAEYPDLGDGRQLWHSADGGNSWQPLTPAGLPSSDGKPRDCMEHLAASPRQSGLLWALVWEVEADQGGCGGSTTALHRSIDGGRTWDPTPLRSGIEASTFSVDPSASATLYLIEKGALERSTDGGATWSTSGQAPAETDSWTTVDVDWQNPNTLYLGAHVSVDGGQTWEEIESPVTYNGLSNSAPHPDGGRLAYENGFYRSFDGKTWERPVQDLPLSNGNVQRLNPLDALAVHATDPSILYAALRTWADSPYPPFWRSIDGGRTWEAYGTGLPVSQVRVYDLIVDPNRAQTIYLSLRIYVQPEPGKALTVYAIYRSDDGGATWQLADQGLPDEELEELTLAGDRLYARYLRAVYRSVDRGESWQLLWAPDETEDPQLRTHDMLMADGRLLLSVSEYQRVSDYEQVRNSRVLRSLDDGQTWDVLPGLPDNTIFSQLAQAGGRLYLDLREESNPGRLTRSAKCRLHEDGTWTTLPIEGALLRVRTHSCSEPPATASRSAGTADRRCSLWATGCPTLTITWEPSGIRSISRTVPISGVAWTGGRPGKRCPSSALRRPRIDVNCSTSTRG